MPVGGGRPLPAPPPPSMGSRLQCIPAATSPPHGDLAKQHAGTYTRRAVSNTQALLNKGPPQIMNHFHAPPPHTFKIVHLPGTCLPPLPPPPLFARHPPSAHRMPSARCPPTPCGGQSSTPPPPTRARIQASHPGRSSPLLRATSSNARATHRRLVTHAMFTRGALWNSPVCAHAHTSARAARSV